MAKAAILVNGARADAVGLAEDAKVAMAALGHEVSVFTLPDANRATGDVPPAAMEAGDLEGFDVAVSLGGDGTFLRLVPLAYAAGVPLLGVNFGRLGFLLEVEPSRFVDVLAQSLSGDLEIEDRAVLAISVAGSLSRSPGDDRSLPGEIWPTATPDLETWNMRWPPGVDRWWVALNEAVVEKTVPGHMVHLKTDIDGEPALHYKADGVLVATPTGSTGYSLSAGGPIVAATLGALVVTPVAAHLAMDRSLVLGPKQVVTVTVEDTRPAVLVVDGREAGRLAPGAAVMCRLAPTPLRMVRLGERSFAGSLRTTLSRDRWT